MGLVKYGVTDPQNIPPSIAMTWPAGIALESDAFRLTDASNDVLPVTGAQTGPNSTIIVSTDPASTPSGIWYDGSSKTLQALGGQNVVPPFFVFL